MTGGDSFSGGVRRQEIHNECMDNFIKDGDGNDNEDNNSLDKDTGQGSNNVSSNETPS